MLEVICAVVSLVGATAAVVFALCARANMEAAREWEQQAAGRAQHAQVAARSARAMVDRAEATYGS